MAVVTVFKPGAEYRTLQGGVARVYATDGAEPFPVHGAIWTHDGWTPASWSAHGTYGMSPSGNDIIPPRPPVVVSDAVIKAGTDEHKRSASPHHRESIRREYAAAIAAYLDEQEAKP